MSELNEATSGAQTTSSGVDETNVESNVSSGADDSNAAYQKLLKEKQNHARAHQTLKTELEELRAEKKEREEKDLLSRNQHEKLISIQREEIAKLKGEITTHRQKQTDAKKIATTIGELKKLGFVDNDANRELVLRLIDKNKVEIDEETNQVLGADFMAKELYDKYNGLGLFGKKSVGTNQSAPNLTNEITRKPISELNQNEIADRLKESLSKVVK